MAMAADVGTASFDRPHDIQQRSREWLIVSRWGRNGEYLTLSRTCFSPVSDAEAPIALAPSVTCVGVLMTPPQVAGVDTFLLTRQLPRDVTVAGQFAPADGFVRLCGPVESLHLTASARDEPDSAGGCDPHPDVAGMRSVAGAGTWHINACRRPWDGEFVERAMLATG
jgi:hypothetical protein